MVEALQVSGGFTFVVAVELLLAAVGSAVVEETVAVFEMVAAA